MLLVAGSLKLVSPVETGVGSIFCEVASWLQTEFWMGRKDVLVHLDLFPFNVMVDKQLFTMPLSLLVRSSPLVQPLPI